MTGVPRRRVLVGAGALAGAAAGPRGAHGHAPFGPVRPPLEAPTLPLVGDDARPWELRRLLEGRVTALQLMFTSCTATCPLQGALFAAVARRLVGADRRLLSVSIAPEDDTPQALAAWLARFAAPGRWRAAAPRPADVDRLLDFCRGRAERPDRHTGQVYLFDRRARLVFRSAELPPVAHIVDVMEQVAARG